MPESITQHWNNYDSGGTAINASKSYSGGSEIKITESIPDSSTDLLTVITLDVSAVQALYIISDQVLLLEPNNGTTPDDPMTLVANVPYVWNTDSQDALFFGTDWTALYVTNSSGSAANLRIRGVVDVTP